MNQKMIFHDLDRIVFAGGSVTDMGSTNPVGKWNEDLDKVMCR